MEKENCCTGSTNNEVDFKSVQLQNNSGCGCDDSGCCDTSSDNNVEIGSEESDSKVNIAIDGISIKVSDRNKNLVEIAKEVGIAIPAPCFLAKRKHGCCNACVVEVDKKRSFACGTKPKDGMNVIVNREDLTAERKVRLLKYKNGIKNGTLQKCGRS